MNDEKGFYTRFNKYSFSIGAVLGLVVPSAYHPIYNQFRENPQYIDSIPAHLMLSVVFGLGFATLGIFTSFFIEDRRNNRKNLESISSDTNKV